jgi:hypothetical protein
MAKAVVVTVVVVVPATHFVLTIRSLFFLFLFFLKLGFNRPQFGNPFCSANPWTKPDTTEQSKPRN